MKVSFYSEAHCPRNSADAVHRVMVKVGRKQFVFAIIDPDNEMDDPFVTAAAVAQVLNNSRNEIV